LTGDAAVDLRAQYETLRRILDGTTDRELDLATPAAGWRIRHQIAHLADTEEVAADTVHGGPRAFAAAIRPFDTSEAFTAAGAARASGKSLAELVDWLARTQDATVDSLGGASPDARIPWGFGLSRRSFCQARIMETWAHTWDICQALGRPMPWTAPARHVAELGHATLPFALRTARIRAPAGRTLRLDLDGDELGRWRIGPTEATDVVRGPASAWVRVATRRADPEDRPALRASGELAELAVRHARAYL
jgi:uncharacterized protein (TIGR03084 family)